MPFVILLNSFKKQPKQTQTLFKAENKVVKRQPPELEVGGSNHHQSAYTSLSLVPGPLEGYLGVSENLITARCLFVFS